MIEKLEKDRKNVEKDRKREKKKTEYCRTGRKR